MSDAAVAEIKTPEATRAGVLAGSRHEVKASTISTALGVAAAGSEAEKLAKALSMAESARKAGVEHPADLKAQLIDASKVSRFTDADSSALKNLLSPTAEENARAEKALTGLADIIKYNEAARTADSTGKGIETVVGGDWDRLHKEVVSRIVNDGNLLSKFPVISEITNPDLLIEELIARDPRLQNEISEELKRIATEAKGKLKTDPDAIKVSELTARKGSLEKITGTLLPSLEARLKSAGITEADQIKDIKEQINNGVDPDTIMVNLEDLLVKSAGIEGHRFVLQSLSNNELFRRSHTERRAEIEAQITAITGSTKEDNAKKKTLTDELTRIDVAVGKLDDDIKGNKETLKDAGVTDPIEIEKMIRSMRTIASNVGENGALAKNIKTISNTTTALRDTNREIVAIESSPETKIRLEEQRAAREQLTSDLENVVSTAMGRFMEKKYADFITDEQTRLGAAAKEAAHKGEKNQEKNIKKLKDEMKKFGHIDKTSRKIVRDRQKIGDRMKEFAYHAGNGEDGKKHLIASEVGFKLDKAEGKNEISTTLFSGRSYDTLNDEEKAKVDADYNKQSADFDKLVTEHGEAYMKSLVSNFIAERGALDRTVFGKPMGSLALTSDEWKTVYPLLTPMIDNELASNKAGKRMMGELRAKGIVPDSKMKWLIWALLAAGIGTIGAVGILPAAAAVGAAAPAIGSAALHGVAA